jgi:hypothetical protein
MGVADIEEMASAAAALEKSQIRGILGSCILLTAEISHLSSSVIWRVSPGATSIVKSALGSTCSGFANTAVAHTAARRAADFISVTLGEFLKIMK